MALGKCWANPRKDVLKVFFFYKLSLDILWTKSEITLNKLIDVLEKDNKFKLSYFKIQHSFKNEPKGILQNSTNFL
jgi:hypothetical protein